MLYLTEINADEYFVGMVVSEMNECSNDHVGMKFLVETINHIRQELCDWHEKEFDAVMECDRLQQDLMYFENKLISIQESDDSV